MTGPRPAEPRWTERRSRRKYGKSAYHDVSLSQLLRLRAAGTRPLFPLPFALGSSYRDLGGSTNLNPLDLTERMAGFYQAF
jgi:hypothetical protein